MAVSVHDGFELVQVEHQEAVTIISISEVSTEKQLNTSLIFSDSERAEQACDQEKCRRIPEACGIFFVNRSLLRDSTRDD